MVGISLTIIILLGVFDLSTGVVSYYINYARCLHQPVTASKFMAGYSYHLPGQSGYGPNPFAEYYCTEQQALNAGFHSSTQQ